MIVYCVCAIPTEAKIKHESFPYWIMVVISYHVSSELKQSVLLTAESFLQLLVTLISQFVEHYKTEPKLIGRESLRIYMSLKLCFVSSILSTSCLSGREQPPPTYSYFH